MKFKIKKFLLLITIFIVVGTNGTQAEEVSAQTISPKEVWHHEITKFTENKILSVTATKSIHMCEQITSIAKRCLGVPYVWGGETIDGFDCSGLVQYIYKQIGVNITRTTYTQVGEGIAVSRDNLRQGDLVFFKKNNDVHHVGIYIGDNQYIHAPQTCEVVKISKLSDRNDYYTARRIIND